MKYLLPLLLFVMACTTPTEPTPDAVYTSMYVVQYGTPPTSLEVNATVENTTNATATFEMTYTDADSYEVKYTTWNAYRKVGSDDLFWELTPTSVKSVGTVKWTLTVCLFNGHQKGQCRSVGE